MTATAFTGFINGLTEEVERSNLMENLKGAQTLKSWAKIVGIPYNTLLKAMRRGEIRAYRFTAGGNFYVLPDDMTAYLEACLVPVKEENDG